MFPDYNIFSTAVLIAELRSEISNPIPSSKQFLRYELELGLRVANTNPQKKSQCAIWVASSTWYYSVQLIKDFFEGIVFAS